MHTGGLLNRYHIEIKIFLSFYVLIVCFTEIYPRIGNENTQYALTQAVVDDHSFIVDRFITPTMEDKAFNDGHYYSDKPPGCSLLMIPLYIFFRGLLGIYKEPLTQWLVIITSICLYSSISVVIYYHLLLLFGIKRRRVAHTFLYVFGTLCFCYSTIGVQEQFVTPLVLASFFFALAYDDRKGMFFSGLFAGLSFFTRYQTLVMVIWLIPFLFLDKQKRKNLLFFLIPFGLVASALLLYNKVCFSHPLIFSTAKFATATGRLPRSVQFWIPPVSDIKEMLISPWRGLFFFSPFLLYSLPGFFQIYKEDWKKGLLLAFSALSFFGFFFFNRLWYGGSDYGFRYMTPGLPLFAMSASFMFERIRYNKLFVFLSVVSILVCTLGVVTSPFSIYYSQANPEHNASIVSYNITHLFVRGTNSLLNDVLRHFGLMDVEMSIYTTLMVFLAFYLLWRDELHPGPEDVQANSE